jgi:hypothetical protein
MHISRGEEAGPTTCAGLYAPDPVEERRSIAKADMSAELIDDVAYGFSRISKVLMAYKQHRLVLQLSAIAVLR